MASVTVIAEESNGYRTFTDTQGRAVEARIIEYDATKGRLQIERLDGKRSWAPPGVFAEADREYIKEWIAANQVLSEKNLVITLKKQKVRSFKEGLKASETRETNPRKGEVICYEVSLKNRAKAPVENLKIDYHYYIKLVGSGTREDQERSQNGRMTVKHLDGLSSTAFKTDETVVTERFSRIAVYSSYSNQFSGYEFQKLSEEQLMGIWLRIYGPPVDGVPSVRDVSYPEDLKEKVQWE